MKLSSIMLAAVAVCVGLLTILAPEAAAAATLAATHLVNANPHADPGLIAFAAAALGMAAPGAIERKEDGADDAKAIANRVMTAFEQFKATNDTRLAEIEKKGVADPVTVEKLAKIEADLAKGEDLNQKLTQQDQQLKAAKDASDELKTQLEAIQVTLRRGNPQADPATRRAELKAHVNVWARGVINAYANGVPNLTEDQKKAFSQVEQEMKALVIANDTTGGYLAPAEYVADIIKAVTEISPVRSIVRLRTTASKGVMIPKRTGQFAARRTGETETRSETTGLAWGMVELTAPEMYAIVDISEQNLEDSAFDLEAEIREEAAEQFAVKEGSEFVSGTGVEQCQGILTPADLLTTNSGSAATIADADGQANGLLTLKHAIKTAYSRNASWLMNRTTLGSVRKMKDAQKQYIWMPGIAMGKPNTIDGDPYVEVPDMPSEGAGNKPIAYGDWRRAYTLLDRIAMQMLRDPYTQADSGLIRFRFRRRVGGRVVLGEAYRALVCSV